MQLISGGDLLLFQAAARRVAGLSGLAAALFSVVFVLVMGPGRQDVDGSIHVIRIALAPLLLTSCLAFDDSAHEMRTAAPASNPKWMITAATPTAAAQVTAYVAMIAIAGEGILLSLPVRHQLLLAMEMVAMQAVALGSGALVARVFRGISSWVSSALTLIAYSAAWLIPGKAKPFGPYPFGVQSSRAVWILLLAIGVFALVYGAKEPRFKTWRLGRLRLT